MTDRLPEDVLDVPATPILFLVGCIRTGSTMLRLMLDHHPSISFQHELHAIAAYRRADGSEPTMDEYRAAIAGDWIVSELIEQGFAIRDDWDYNQTVENLLHFKHRRDAKPICGATVHRRFSLLPCAFPNSRYIHLIRDGRDVSRSVMKMRAGGNSYCASDFWIQAMDEWDRLKSQLSDEQFIEVRFEDLVRRPDEELDSICRFIGVSFSESMYSYEGSSTYKRPEASAAERWRSWDPREIRRLERKLAPLLRRFDYPITTENPRPPSTTLDLLMWIDDKARSLIARIERYGASLYLQRQIVKVLPLSGYRQRVIDRHQEVDLSLRK